MQKHARDYLNELNRRRRKNRRALVAWILMAVLVVGGVMGTLAQYGFAEDTAPTETLVTEAAAQANEDTGDNVDDKTGDADEEIQEPEGQPSSDNDNESGDKNDGESADSTGKEDSGDEQNSSSGAAGDVTTSSTEGTPAGTTGAGTESSSGTEQPESTTEPSAESTTEPTGTSEESTTETEETSEEPTTETEEQSEEETLSPEVDTTQKIDGSEAQIKVYAAEGVLPEGTQLSVKPIVKRTEEELEKLSAEEREEAEAINAEFDRVRKELEASAEKNGQKELLHFEAFDIGFLANDENGEQIELHELEGDVNVTVNFPENSSVQAFSPEKALEGKTVDLETVDVELVHMKETPEVLEDAGIDGVEGNETDVSQVSFTSDSFSVYAIAWMGDVTGFTYENDDVTITVTETEGAEGAIPKYTKLNVVPIEEEGETAQKYIDVAQKLREKAEEEGYEIAGFLAYDISFIDREGTKTEPNGQVKVEIKYQNPSIPEEVNTEEYSVAAVSEEDAAAVPEEEMAVVQPRMQTKAFSGITAKALNGMAALNSTTLAAEEITEEEEEPAEKSQLGITVMHLEEDENGNVTDVVDMGAEGKVNALDSTENQEVTKTEFVTDSFSTFVITWKYYSGEFKIIVHYVDEGGKDLIPESTLNDVETQNSATIDLSTYVYPVLDYSFDRIVIDDIVNGTQIGRLQQTYSKSQKTYTIQRDNRFKTSSWKNAIWGGSSSSWTDWLSSSGNTNGDIYIIYKPIQPQTSGSQAAAPAHRKYIEKKSDGTYTLTLDVTGRQDAAKPIDVLLIVDKSGSMKGDGTTNVNNAITELKKSLLKAVNDNKGLQVYLGVVTFSGKKDDSYYNNKDSQVEKGWTQLTSENSFDWSLSSPDGGTNWQAGIRTGEEMLHSRPADHRKYVVFLTDGDPTYRYDIGDETTVGDGNSDDSNNSNYNAAVNEWKTSSTLQSTVARFVIDANPTGNNKCDEFAAMIGAKELSGTSTDMKNSFNKIATAITNPGYTDVVITDTLSDYVEFVEENPTPTVTTYPVGEDSDPVPLDTNKYTVTTSGKTITLDLKNVGKLSNNTIYSISFNVKPTQKAMEDYKANGDYIVNGNKIKGDELTDVPGMDPGSYTSSKQDGFYSNDAVNTKLTYTYNEGTSQDASYPRPVIQVNKSGLIDKPETPNPIDGSITKTMGNIREDGKYPITLEVKTRYESSSESANVDVILIIDTSDSMNDNSRLANTKVAAKSFVNTFIGPKGTNSTVHRVGIVTFGSSAKEVQGLSGNSDTVNKAIDELTASGGTNTEAGFTQAEKLVDPKNSKNTYVIMMTDGVPTFHGTNTEGGGNYATMEDYNGAVQAAYELKQKVAGIYTVGLLDGMTEGSANMDIARTLLASGNSDHQSFGYEKCYKARKMDYYLGFFQYKYEYEWDETTDYTYSDGYFEITTSTDAATKLQQIWEKLGTIINNKHAGSTGDGWTVTDTMASHIELDFNALDKSLMNGYILTLETKEGKPVLTTELIVNEETKETEKFTVAEYDSQTKTIIWHLDSRLASKSGDYVKEGATAKGRDYTYALTYYVDFSDSQRTEVTNTNATTYITIPGQEEDPYLYPDKMPYYINVVGSKVDAGTKQVLSGAEFAVYRGMEGEQPVQPIAENIAVDANGHFAFQIGQSDLAEDGTMTVYLKETKAPEGYTLDTLVHPIKISVSQIQYQQKSDSKANCIKDSQAGLDWGKVVSATVEIQDDHAVENDLLAISSDGTMQLVYGNAHKDPWGIIKRNGATGVALAGAKFELYKITDSVVAETPSYEATSGADGRISKWTDKVSGNEVDSFNLTGKYELREALSPEGYAKSEEVWIVEMVAGTANITVKGSGTAKPQVADTPNYYYFDDVLLYELPSTGGIGIYWYMIGGVLLMMAGVLILYKNKRSRRCAGV